MESLRDSARGLALELVVIVLGVLIALAVDAAWDAAQERRVRDELLHALAGDLQQGATMISDQLSAVEAELSDVQALLEAIYRGDSVDPTVAADALRSSSDWADLPMGAYLGALNSGALGLLPPALNRELALLPPMQERVTDNVNLFLQAAYFGSYSDAVNLTGGVGSWLPFGPPVDEDQIIQGLAERNAVRGVEQLYLLQFNRGRMLSSLSTQLDRIQKLVARELE